IFTIFCNVYSQLLWSKIATQPVCIRPYGLDSLSYVCVYLCALFGICSGVCVCVCVYIGVLCDFVYWCAVLGMCYSVLCVCECVCVCVCVFVWSVDVCVERGGVWC